MKRWWIGCRLVWLMASVIASLPINEQQESADLQDLEISEMQLKQQSSKTAAGESPRVIIDGNKNDTDGIVQIQTEPDKSGNSSNPHDEPPYVYMVIAFGVLIIIIVGLHFQRAIHCSGEFGILQNFEYRSEDVDRYNTRQQLEARQNRFNKRYTPCANYPNAPAYDENQKYMGNNRLPKYRKPGVSIIDEDTGKIVMDVNDLSLDNTLSICKSGCSDKDIVYFKHSVEAKRRLQQERKAEIDRCKTKRNNSNDLEAITETDDMLLPQYRSKESLNNFQLLVNEAAEKDWVRAPPIAEEEQQQQQQEQAVPQSTTIEVVYENEQETVSSSLQQGQQQQSTSTSSSRRVLYEEN